MRKPCRIRDAGSASAPRVSLWVSSGCGGSGLSRLCSVVQLGPCVCWKSLAAGRETLPQQITTTRGEGGIWSNCDRIRDAHPSLELRQSLRNLGVDTWVEHLARGVVVHPLERIFRCVSALARTPSRGSSRFCRRTRRPHGPERPTTFRAFSAFRFSFPQRSTCRFRAGRRRAARPNVERATRRARVRPDRSIHFSVDISTDIGSKNPQQSKLRAFAGTSEFVSSPPLDHCPTSQQPQHRPCRGSQTNAVIHCCQKITCAPESSDAVVCDSACDAVSESSRFISRVRSLMSSLVRE